MEWKTIEYDKVDSTNDEARRLIVKGEGEGLVVHAKHQLRGRGRRSRTWWSLPGRSILASFVFEDIDGSEATRLISVSTIAAIRGYEAKGPLIKWPNDLVYGRKKAGGILSESFVEDGVGYTIVGLGLNLNYTKKELVKGRRFSATSLQVEEGKPWDARSLLENIKAEIEKRLRGDGGKNLAEYRGDLAFIGKKISLVLEGSRSTGVFAGVDNSGFLLLETGEGVKHFPVGEVGKVRM